MRGFKPPAISDGMVGERIQDAVNELARSAVSFLTAVRQVHTINIGRL